MTNETTNGASSVPAVQQGGDVALNADMLALMEEAKGDAQKFTLKETRVPYLQIVAGTSQVVQRASPIYNPNARLGQLYYTATRWLGDAALFIPCVYEVHYTRWTKRGGALVRQYFTDRTEYDRCPGDDGMPRRTEDGQVIIPSDVYYGLFVHDPSQGLSYWGIVSMASTNRSSARDWNTLIGLEEAMGPNGPFVPPIYARAYLLTTTPMSNEDNDGQRREWSVFQVKPDKYTLTLAAGRGLFEKAKALRKAVLAGEARAAAPTSDAADPGAPSEGARRGAEGAGNQPSNASGEEPPPPLDDDIPF
jgi:hypothetical protein